MSATKITLACVVACLLSLSAGYFGRTVVDKDLISITELTSDESPVVVVEKTKLGEFLQYVRILERTVSQCKANKSI